MPETVRRTRARFVLASVAEERDSHECALADVGIGRATWVTLQRVTEPEVSHA